MHRAVDYEIMRGARRHQPPPRARLNCCTPPAQVDHPYEFVDKSVPETTIATETFKGVTLKARQLGWLRRYENGGSPTWRPRPVFRLVWERCVPLHFVASWLVSGGSRPGAAAPGPGVGDRGPVPGAGGPGQGTSAPGPGIVVGARIGRGREGGGGGRETRTEPAGAHGGKLGLGRRRA